MIYRNSSDPDAPTRRLTMALALMAAGLGLCPRVAAATAATPDDVQYFVAATIQPGETATYGVVIATVPAGKLLVITSISYYRRAVQPNSIGQIFISTAAGGTNGNTVLPEAKADGSIFPASSLTTTLYADAGTNVSCNVYTSIAPSSAESDYVTVTGYLLPQK